jgi:hypothetical protein
MAIEKFHIVAVQMPKDCFSRFSETANLEAKESGAANQSDAYGWIEAAFEIVLIREREATYICSFEPTQYYIWLQNAFVGTPNGAWEYDGDPDGLEMESGGDCHGYMGYRDDWPKAFICSTIKIDTVKDLGLRKPRIRNTLSRRTEKEVDALESYNKQIWASAEESAHEIGRNGGFWCDGLNAETWRKAQRPKDRARDHEPAL